MEIKPLRPGQYSAIASGCFSRFHIDFVEYTAKFNIGVRSLGAADTITINPDQTIVSVVLGKDGILVDKLDNE